MELVDLYKEFNDLQDRRTRRRLSAMDPCREPPRPVLLDWAQDWTACQGITEKRLGFLANLIVAWQRGGRRAAIYWLLTNT